VAIEQDCIYLLAFAWLVFENLQVSSNPMFVLLWKFGLFMACCCFVGFWWIFINLLRFLWSVVVSTCHFIWNVEGREARLLSILFFIASLWHSDVYMGLLACCCYVCAVRSAKWVAGLFWNEWASGLFRKVRGQTLLLVSSFAS
jgi:hypothetical protein